MNKFRLLIATLFVTLSALAQPTNDDINNPEQIIVTNSSVTTVTFDINSTTIYNPSFCPDQNSADVWYQFIMPVNGNIYIDGSVNMNNFSLFDASDNTLIYCGRKKNVLFSDLIEGNSYILKVWRYASTASNVNNQSFNIVANEYLANDNCVNAEQITITNTFNTFNYNSTSTIRNDQTICGETENFGDLWYKFTMPANGNILVIPNFFVNSRKYALYNTCGGTEIQCDSAGGPMMFNNLTAGNTYLMRVYRSSFVNYSNDLTSSFRIKFIEELNDECSKAQEIVVTTSSASTFESFLYLAPHNPIQTCGGGTFNGQSSWYEFIMPVDGLISLKSNTFNTNNYMLYDSCLGIEQECGSSFGDVVFSELIGGNTYLLRFHDTNPSITSQDGLRFRIQAFEKAVNDNCNDAEQIIVTNLPTNISIDIDTGTRLFRKHCQFDDIIDPAAYVWYKFTMPINGNVIVEGDTPEITYSLYENCSTNNPIYCEKGGAFFPNLIEGETYYLSPSKSPGAPGTNYNFTIKLIDAVDNDNCINAETIPLINDTPTIVNFNINGALRDDSIFPCVNPNGFFMADVWYEFNMPINGNIVVDGGETNLNYFALYDICGGPAINYCGRNKLLFSNLNAGNNYLLRVNRFQSDIQNVDHQSFSINTVESVSNDDCINTQQITVNEQTPTSINFNINDAARYIEETICSLPSTLSPTVADVWYEFTMPINGNMQVDGGSSINHFELYDTCNSTVIDCSTNSIIFTSLTAGNNYSLRVLRTQQHAFNGDNQNFTITIGEFLSTDDNIFENTISIYPNPANTILNISIEDNQSIKAIELYNILGKKILKTKVKKIDVSDFQSGIYIIRILTEKGQAIKRIVIQ